MKTIKNYGKNLSNSMKNSLEKDWGNVWELEEIKEITEKAPFDKVVSDILSKYQKGSRVLDAGSGLGKWVFNWQRKGYQAYGIDIVFEAVKRSREYAKKNNLDCQFLVGDVRKMPFSDNFFDFIFSYGTIEHFPESPQAIKEFCRVLKEGGTCLVTTPNVYSVRTFLTRPILKILKNPQLGYQGYEKSFTPKKLFKMMEKVGFKELKCGILPDGILLGDFYKFIPLLGKYLSLLPKKISFWVENHQSILGHTSYCIGVKTG